MRVCTLQHAMLFGTVLATEARIASTTSTHSQSGGHVSTTWRCIITSGQKWEQSARVSLSHVTLQATTRIRGKCAFRKNRIATWGPNRIVGPRPTFPAFMTLCKGTTLEGRPCRRSAAHGQAYCHSHYSRGALPPPPPPRVASGRGGRPGAGGHGTPHVACAVHVLSPSHVPHMPLSVACSMAAGTGRQARCTPCCAARARIMAQQHPHRHQRARCGRTSAAGHRAH